MADAPIYLDHHATTPVDERVLDAMLPYFREHFGNAASRSHPYGWRAEEGVDKARKQVAELIGARNKEIVFTSGATESDNLAIKGVVLAALRDRPGRRPHVVTAQTEHKAVLDACRALEDLGADVSYVAPDADGVVPAARVAEAMTDETVLVSLMHVNNEIGTINPIEEVGALCRAHEVPHKVFFHVDAVQSLGRLPFDVDAVKADLVAISAHKIYGPKGVGALYVRRKPKVPLVPLIDGGGHERGMRSGTLNVPGIVGLGEACALAGAHLDDEPARVLGLRERLRETLQSELPMVELNGSLEQRVAGNLNLSFAFVEAESLLLSVQKDVALSSGSACTSATLEPSYVLKAIGVSHDLAHSSIRFGIGRTTTEDEIERAGARVVKAVRDLREKNPAWQSMQRRQERQASDG
jgi:cysteine desulfurase